jgi:hypothetical protein
MYYVEEIGEFTHGVRTWPCEAKGCSEIVGEVSGQWVPAFEAGDGHDARVLCSEHAEEERVEIQLNLQWCREQEEEANELRKIRVLWERQDWG